MEQPVEKEFEAVIDTAEDVIDVAIIDDDPLFSLMLQDYLLTSDMRSELFSNGKLFIENYKKNDTRKIILDYEFSEGPDGLSILQNIKSMNPMANVIIVSGQDNLEKAVEILRKGATDYFLKTNHTVFANILCSLMKIKEIEKNRLN